MDIKSLGRKRRPSPCNRRPEAGADTGAVGRTLRYGLNRQYLAEDPRQLTRK
ncbi:hypothetical protein J3R74_000507 [Puniceicoccus vermicola]